MKRAFLLTILLFFNNLRIFGQNPATGTIRLSRTVFLTQNLDSLTRSFSKKGFKINLGKRQPLGIFDNSIEFHDGATIILQTTLSNDPADWRVNAIKNYGAHIAGLAFEVEHLDSLERLLKANNIPVVAIQGSTSAYIALDSCWPLDIVFSSRESSFKRDSSISHRNHVHRFDWLLLSASPDVEARLRKVFAAIGALGLHEGCCDFWRVGPPDDFCFFRFEIAPPKAKGKTGWLSIEQDGYYFAY